MVEMDEIYGHRARIGYASPPLLTEVFAYDFYRLAPAGVTLALTSLAIPTGTRTRSIAHMRSACRRRAPWRRLVSIWLCSAA